MQSQAQESTKHPSLDSEIGAENAQNTDSLFSPRFKSLAAMAGWDEESILTASLVIEDTPDRDSKHKKRSDFITPPSNSSRRKRRAQRKSLVSISVPVITLDEEEDTKKQEIHKLKIQERKEDELKKERTSVSCSNSSLPCMDKLRDELSCAICLEICFEPSTTSCGHSFCKKCLRSAADKCGKKCPKCRQLISNGRSCTVNTVLWNTIQLLFPQEVEARKAANAVNSQEAQHQTPAAGTSNVVRSQNLSRDSTARRRSTFNQDQDSARSQQDDLSRLLSSYASGISRRAVPSQSNGVELASGFHRETLSRLSSRDVNGRRRRRCIPSQDEDAALALRLQREEFMDAFGGTNEQSGSSVSSARENFRAMAARAVDIRVRRLRNHAT